MGGIGSERRNKNAKKRIVEDCWILDLAEVQVSHRTDPPNRCGVLLSRRINDGLFPLPVNYTFSEKENALYLEITYPEVRPDSTDDVEECIKLLSTRLNYGGTRWYFSCPFTTEAERCNNRVSKLYLPPEEQRFGCRECHDLTYRSSQESHKFDSLYALWAGGERKGETFDIIKWVFSSQLKEARRHRAESEEGWLEVFEEFYGEDL